MAYNYAQRNAIAETDETFRGTIGGALFTHAEYRVARDATPAEGAELRVALSIISNIGPFITTAARAVLFSPSQNALSDVTSLSDETVLSAVQASWSTLVSAWTGEATG